MVHILHTDGTRTEMDGKPSLEELQAAVGGYIEHVRITGRTGMYVNEEGLLMGLRTNPIATLMANKMIVGDVVVYGPGDDV